MYKRTNRGTQREGGREIGQHERKAKRINFSEHGILNGKNVENSGKHRI